MANFIPGPRARGVWPELSVHRPRPQSSPHFISESGSPQTRPRSPSRPPPRKTPDCSDLINIITRNPLHLDDVLTDDSRARVPNAYYSSCPPAAPVVVLALGSVTDDDSDAGDSHSKKALCSLFSKGDQGQGVWSEEHAWLTPRLTQGHVPRVGINRASRSRTMGWRSQFVVHGHVVRCCPSSLQAMGAILCQHHTARHKISSRPTHATRRVVRRILRELIGSLPLQPARTKKAKKSKVAGKPEPAASSIPIQTTLSQQEPPELVPPITRSVSVQALMQPSGVEDLPSCANTTELSLPERWVGGARALRDSHVRLVLRQLRHIERLNRALDQIAVPAPTTNKI